MPTRRGLQAVDPASSGGWVPRQASVPPHVVVVGGGITGLAAAWSVVRAAPDARVTVLERASSVGGHMSTGMLAGMVVDRGAESMVASRPEAVLLARQVGLEADLVAPGSMRMSVWTRGRVRPLPRGQYLGIPTDLRALAASEVLSWGALLRIPLDRVRPATPLPGDVSVGQFVASRLGPEVVASLVDPLLGGVYAGRADDLSLAATMPALYRAMKGQRSLLAATAEIAAGGAVQAGARRGAPYRGIVGGIGRLPGVVAGALVARGVQVRTETTVRGLTRQPAGWTLTVGPANNPETVRADAVIVAVPSPAAARLLAQAAPEAAAALAGLEHASVAVVHVALPAGAIPPAPAASTLLVPASAGRVSKSVTFSDVKWNWMAQQSRAAGLQVLRVAVGRYGETEVIARPDAELGELVAADLQFLLGIRERPVDMLVSRWGGALPQYRVGHRELVQRVRSAMDLVPSLDVAGAAFDGVGVAACIGSATEAARRVLADLDRIRALSG